MNKLWDSFNFWVNYSFKHVPQSLTTRQTFCLHFEQCTYILYVNFVKWFIWLKNSSACSIFTLNKISKSGIFYVESSTPTDAKSDVKALWNKGRCCLNSLCCWYQLRSFRCALIRKFQTKVEWTRARNPPWRIVLRSRPLSLAEWFDRSDKKLIAPLCCLSTSFSVRLISVLWNTEWAPAMENILLRIDQVELLV